jgi:hypothetical protein
MESYESMLAVGGKSNSLGRADEVISSVYGDPSRLDELFNCILADDAWVRMRAVDSFEKITRQKPEWIQPYLDKIFSDLTLSSQPSIQWHLAQIFSEVQLTDEQREGAIAWLKDKIKTIDVDWIVSVNVMKALVYFHQNGYISVGELNQLFEIQEAHKSKSVRKKVAYFRLST